MRLVLRGKELSWRTRSSVRSLLRWAKSSCPVGFGKSAGFRLAMRAQQRKYSACVVRRLMSGRRVEMWGLVIMRCERLVVEHSTVKTHVRRALTKLGVGDGVYAVILAYETAVVRAGEG